MILWSPAWPKSSTQSFWTSENLVPKHSWRCRFPQGFMKQEGLESWSYWLSQFQLKQDGFRSMGLHRESRVWLSFLLSFFTWRVKAKFNPLSFMFVLTHHFSTQTLETQQPEKDQAEKRNSELCRKILLLCSPLAHPNLPKGVYNEKYW